MAAVAAQEQPANAGPPGVNPFLFELLQLQLTELQDQIQQQLGEIAHNLTTSMEQLRHSVGRKVDGLNNRINAMQGLDERGRGVRTLLIDQLNVSYWGEMLENFSADPRLDGEWIVFQHRFNGSVNFSRDWREYADGFGDLRAEHWLGLDNLHRVLGRKRHELLVLLESFDGETRYASYDDFQIGDASTAYAIESLGRYSGTAGDSLEYHKGMKFSTQDQDNDTREDNCAVAYHGGWWYRNCYSCNLNGKYVTGKRHLEEGLIWVHFKGPFSSLKMSKMLIRPYRTGRKTSR